MEKKINGRHKKARENCKSVPPLFFVERNLRKIVFLERVLPLCKAFTQENSNKKFETPENEN